MSLRDDLNVQGKMQKSKKPFPLQQKKILKNQNEDGNEDVFSISYKILFIEKARFMSRLL